MSVFHHLKVACLSANVALKRINLGRIVGNEMAVRAKQRQTSLPFPTLITELYKQAWVPRDAEKDVEVNRISSTDIQD